MCECPPDVKVSRTIAPHPQLVRHAQAVTLTICDCDRLYCPVNGCNAKVTPIHGATCVNGHRWR